MLEYKVGCVYVIEGMGEMLLKALCDHQGKYQMEMHGGLIYYAIRENINRKATQQELDRRNDPTEDRTMRCHHDNCWCSRVKIAEDIVE